MAPGEEGPKTLDQFVLEANINEREVRKLRKALGRALGDLTGLRMLLKLGQHDLDNAITQVVLQDGRIR